MRHLEWRGRRESVSISDGKDKTPYQHHAQDPRRRKMKQGQLEDFSHDILNHANGWHKR